MSLLIRFGSRTLILLHTLFLTLEMLGGIKLEEVEQLASGGSSRSAAAY
jgi:hypothetical protein